MSKKEQAAASVAKPPTMRLEIAVGPRPNSLNEAAHSAQRGEKDAPTAPAPAQEG